MRRLVMLIFHLAERVHEVDRLGLNQFPTAAVIAVM